jgi:hypothetical protein
MYPFWFRATRFVVSTLSVTVVLGVIRTSDKGSSSTHERTRSWLTTQIVAVIIVIIWGRTTSFFGWLFS